MKHRKLRIAWSASSGIVAVLLVTLWVLSYWRSDVVCVPGSPSTTVWAIRGVINVSHIPQDSSSPSSSGHTSFSPYIHSKDRPEPPSWQLEVGPTRSGNIYCLAFPIWSVLVLFVLASAAPWLRWHFRLRTLLIATTLVAVGLGLIVRLW
jgi:hypothetical protein